MPLHIVAFYVLLALAGVSAAATGGRAERQVASMLVVATAASRLLAWQLHGHFVHFEVALFAVDALLLAGLLATAMTSDRYWPLWLTPLHAYTVIAHLGRLAVRDTYASVYLTNSALTTHLGLIIVILASWRHRRRHRRSQASATQSN